RPPAELTDAQLPVWLQEQLQSSTDFFHSVSTLVNRDLAEALGPPGKPADIQAVVRVARDLAGASARARTWAAWIQRAKWSPRFERITREVGSTVEEPIRELDEFGARMISSINTAMASPKGSPERTLNVTLELRLANEQGLLTELQALQSAGGVTP